MSATKCLAWFARVLSDFLAYSGILAYDALMCVAETASMCVQYHLVRTALRYLTVLHSLAIALSCNYS